MVERSITATLQLGSGFAVANAAGFVFVFEFAGAGMKFKRNPKFQLHKDKILEQEERPFVLRNRLCCTRPISLSSTPEPPNMLGQFSAASEQPRAPAVFVRTMTANPEESAMAAVFSDGQVRAQITRHARTHCVCKSQSCMFYRWLRFRSTTST